ncbi:serine hydrolase domain-containing protein [Chitinophaga sp. GCM10012297]|uniref:Beta-lactamase family protein n=1 Tax=Chitinophaga chungangae TaxID=2821488 RepID=A0ABS3YKD3_9BACT|nr:serine hydrolase domain-containing protein [Chitinophaga chungangae]MBO9154584.1 beta-lactamase family protein [Chitinophaga chungangae]
MLKQTLFAVLVTLPFLTGRCQSASEADLLLKQAKADTLLQAYAAQNNFNGTALVALHGKIILQKGYGWRNIEKHIPNDINSIYQAASVTKTFTGTLVMKLAELKKLSLEDKLSKYYPDYPGGDSITIAQLLSHTSGIFNYTMNRDFMLQKAAKPATEQEMLALFRNEPRDFAPGTGWNYSNSGYMLLGYIIQKVTGKRYDEAMRHYVFRPLGMHHSGFDFARLEDQHKATGYAADSTGAWTVKTPIVDSSVSFAAGSIYTTAGDLFRWHEGLTKYAIVSPAGWQEISMPKKDKYGYGWMNDSLQGKPTNGHSGGIWGFRSNFVRVQEDDACVILLSNSETFSLDGITNKLFAILYNKPYQVPVVRTTIQLDTALLRKYTGTYLLEEKDLKIHIVLENGELAAYPENGPRSTLCATSPSCFFLKEDTDFETCFITDATGKGVSMKIHKGDRGGTAKRLDE